MMIFKKPRTAAISVCVLAVLLTVFLAHPARADSDTIYGKVTRVVDGDTVRLANGETIRYVGIDTPEAGEPFYKEAGDRNRALVLNKRVKAVICRSQPRDRYSRLLAWVWVDGTLVNKALLKEGFASVLVIPPCGLVTESEFETAQNEARSRRLGIWSIKAAQPKATRPAGRVYVPERIGTHVGEYAAVKGRVVSVRKSASATFLNFDRPKKGFTAVIFAKSYVNFKRRSIDPASFSGKAVEITGTVSLYKGRPQMIVSSPDQIRLVK